jgi:hypothetical protein
MLRGLPIVLMHRNTNAQQLCHIIKVTNMACLVISRHFEYVLLAAFGLLQAGGVGTAIKGTAIKGTAIAPPFVIWIDAHHDPAEAYSSQPMVYSSQPMVPPMGPHIDADAAAAGGGGGGGGAAAGGGTAADTAGAGTAADTAGASSCTWDEACSLAPSRAQKTFAPSSNTDEHSLDKYLPHLPPPPANSDAVMKLLPSSGTTGRSHPKLIVLTDAMLRPKPSSFGATSPPPSIVYAYEVHIMS